MALRRAAVWVLTVCVALLATLASDPTAFAAGSDGGPISSFPITGAYSAVFREDRNDVSIIEMAGNYDRDLPSGQFNAEPRSAIAREFFRTHPDQYDFLVVFSTFEFQTGDAVAFELTVRNDTQGIGVAPSDITQLFGSHSKLQGYIDMAALTRYATDPSDPNFEFVLSTLAHEMLHRWASFVHFKQADGTLSDALLGQHGVHWSYLLDSNASVQYGADWKDNGNGTFSAVGIRKFYSPLDLYLAGFYKPEEVPPFFLIDNSSVDKTQLPQENATVTGTKRLVTVNDIIAAEGPRVPAADQSQKEFRLAFVVLTGPNKPVTDAQITAVNNVRNAFMTRFSILTGGRGVAHVFPEAMPTVTEGTPTPIDGGTIRTTPSNLDDGMAWLRSRQTSDGSWSDKDTTTVRDTTVAATVLGTLDTGFTGSGAALQWLGTHPSANVDYLARQSKLITDLRGDATSLRAQLMTLQNADGGWGVGAGYQSDPLDSALAILALSGSTAAQGVITQGAQYLLANQNADGGWSTAAGAPSRTTVTTTVLRALQSVGKQSTVASSAVSWLKTKQNADGGFGDSPSTVHDTANVLQVLMLLDSVGQIRPSDATNFILSRQTTTGSWEGSVYSTATALSALRRFSFPNLVLRSITAAPTSPHDGDRVQFTIVVNNDGNVNSQPSIVRLYDGDPAAGGIPVGTDLTVPILPPGIGVTFTPLWDSLNKAGAHTFFAVVDPNNAQVETSKKDNSASVAVTVQPAPANVDLTFGVPDITVTPAQPNRLPTSLAISLNVRNLGLADAHNVPVSLWAGPVGTGTLVGQSTVDVLARSNAVVNFSYTLNQPGTTTLTAQIDPANTFPVEQKSNTTATISITPAGSIDLSVVPSDVTVDKSPVVTGNDATFTVRLFNHGTQDSPSAVVRYSITDGNSTEIIRTNSVQLNAGQSTTQTIPWRVDLSGQLTFTVQADPDGLIPDLDRSNNVATLAVASGNPSGVNLAVSFQDFTANPNPGKEGYPLTLAAIVRNTGTVVANNVEVAFYNGDPASGGVQIGATQNIVSLAPGASTTATLTWSAVPDSTDKLLFVVVDPANKIAEFSKTDNTAFNVVPILSLPDLAIASGDIQLSPPFPKTGQTATITARIANLGAQSASNVLVRAYDGDPAAGGVQIGGNQTISSMAGFGTATVTFTWSSSAVSRHSIFVQVDPLNAILERNKANNTASRDVAVQNGDLYVTEKYFSPDGDGVKDTTQLFFRLQSPVTVAVNVVNKRDQVVRQFTKSVWKNATSGDVVWDGLDSLGRLVQDGTYRLRLVDGSGTSFGETSVEVDTNRSSLLEAVNTKYASYSNLTCQLPSIANGIALTGDDSAIFFNIQGGHSPQAAYPLGLYTMAGDGTDIRAVVPESFFLPKGAGPGGVPAVAANGTRAVFTVADFHQAEWVVDADGKNAKQLLIDQGFYNLWTSPDGKRVYAQNQQAILSFDVDSGAIKSTLYAPPDGAFIADEAAVSKDGSKIAIYVYDPVLDGYGVWIVDAVTGATTRLQPGTVTPSTQPLVWAPNSALLAVSQDKNQQVLVFRPDGSLVRTLPSPIAVAPNEQVAFSQISWASSSSEFAFGLRHTANGGGEYGGGYGYGYGYGSGTVDDPGGVFVADLVTGTVARAADYTLDMGSASTALLFGGTLYWVPGERSLLYFNAVSFNGRIKTTAILLDEGNQQKPAFIDWENFDFRDLHFSPTGRQLLFTSNKQSIDPTSLCYEGINTADVWSFRSLLNLTADLRAVRSQKAGGVQLSGTASDLNFSSYVLEYATASSPNQWQPIAPASGQPVIDDLFTTWIPPAAGNYFVRLTVQDLAGNTRQTIKRVSWAETPSITDVYRTPAMISPNGDGVDDAAAIHYRVLEPVHLSFDFFNEAGVRVRTIVRDDSTVGDEATVIWDGRDDRGLTVPDGKYRMTVLDYEFFITVDNTTPAVALEFHPLYQRVVPAAGVPPVVGVDPGIEWSATDLHLDPGSALAHNPLIESGVGQDPTEWTDISATPLGCSYPMLSQDPDRHCTGRDITDFANHRFRVTATDLAGNTTVAVTPLAPEQLIASAFGNHTPVACESVDPSACRSDIFKLLSNVPYTNLSDSSGGSLVVETSLAQARFTVAETIRKPVAQLFVEYHLATESNWTAAPLTEFYLGGFPLPVTGSSGGFIVVGEVLAPAPSIPEGYIRAVWDMAGVQGGQIYVVRLRAVDVSGATFYSNAFRFHTQGLVFNGVYNRKPRIVDVEAALRKTPLSHENPILWAKQFVAQPLQSVKLYVSSKEDPRYAQPTVIGEVAYPDTTFVYGGDLRSCTKYQGYLVGQTEARPDPATGLPITTTIKTEPQDFSTDCLKLTVSVEPVPAQGCDVPSKNQIAVHIKPESLDDQQLKLLTLSRPLPNGSGEDVLFNVNKPASTQTYDYLIDTSQLSETATGSPGYEFTARIVNVADQQTEQTVNVVIDHTPPVARVTYPLEGQKICAVPFVYQGKNGPENHSSVTVEGEVTDQGGFNYLVEEKSALLPDFTLQHNPLEINPRLYSLVTDTKKQDSFIFSPDKTLPAPPFSPAYSLHDASGPLAKIYDPNGTVTVRLRVPDWGGFQRCEVRTFEVDGQVDAPRASLDSSLPNVDGSRLFSPNGDGVLDQATINYGADEPVTVDINVFTGSLGGDGRVVPSGNSLRAIVAQQQILAGDTSVIWDGTGTSGAVVPDGQYVIVVSLKDACGNIKEFRLPIVVDNTPPVINIAYPRSTDSLPTIVEIQGSLTDVHPQGFGVDFGVGSFPDAWVRVGSGLGNVTTTAVLGKWNTYGLEAGAYAIRVVASDAAGNQSVKVVPVTLAERANLIGNLEASPTLFSLNGDGKHTSSIRYELLQDAVVTLKLLDHTGTPRRTLANAQSIAKGPVAVTWDGRDDQGQPLPDDSYIADLVATAASNSLQRQEEKTTVTLDSTAPLLDVTRPANGFVPAVGGIVGSINDLHLDQYTLSITSSPASPVWQVLDTENQVRVNAVLGSIQGLPDGDYAVRLESNDLAQNRASKIIPFTIDSTPPKVALTAPAPGVFVGVAHNPVNVTGTLDEAHLQTYRVHAGNTDLTTGTTLPLPATLVSWDVSHLSDGPYTLQFIAQDKAGNSAQDTRAVIVDNTAPTAAITQPADFSYVTKPIAILGTATDTNFLDYKLEVAPGAKGTSTRWSDLGSGSVAVSGDVLVQLQALPPDGVQTLRLTVRDKADNVTQTVVQVIVDTQPPAAPLNLTATVESAHNAHLVWTPNTEPDLAGYSVFRDGLKITSALVTNASYIDVNVLDGHHTYLVKAYDKAGLESQSSNQVVVVIDTTPPTTHITLPTTGTLVSGLVDIKGTAYSADDFKEYRLSVGTGAAPTDYQLLRRSPVPVLSDLLSQWNTIGLTDDLQYTIKLEAEDINGNIGSDTATVTVHNKPPAAPIGLKAVANGSTVTLTWTANTDVYLLGYLLYRNDHLANQQGVLVGSLKPYAIATTTYTDPSLPNGPFTYYVVAIDKAGNTSDPSNSVQVVIHTHPPHATIVQPANNTSFEKALYVLATDPDLDVAKVQFQYRAVGAPTWTNLSSPVTTLPYGVTFDPATLGLPFASYQLQAIATDQSNSTDPAPTPITVTYKKLTPPAVTIGLTNHVQGGVVTLNWTANTESDLAGYFVERTDSSNTTTRLTATPITAITYVDSNVADGTYQYRIVAVDTSSNEATKSQPSTAIVYTPTLKQPYTPTTSSTVSLVGSGQSNSTVSGELRNSVGTAALPSATTTETGSFSVPNVPLALGANTITLRLTDAGTNVSKDATVPVTVGTVPSKPTGLAAVPTGHQVSLAWNANPEADVSGYHVFRNGQLVLPDMPMTDLTATASSQYAPWAQPANAVDGNTSTAWIPQANTAADVVGQWLAVKWPQLRDVTHIDILWDGVETRAVDFDIEALNGAVWVPVAQIRGNTSPSNHIDLDHQYRTTQLRVLLLAADGSLMVNPPVRLLELGVLYRPIISTHSFTDTSPDGMQEYTVTAVNNYAFESVPSDSVRIAVGDVTPPDPVTVTAAVSQSDVTITWTPSTATDIDHYLIYRDGVLISSWTDLVNLQFVDPALANGTYHYTIIAVDHVNNSSAPSNDAVATVAIVPPLAPLTLSVSVVATGGALDLSWADPPGTIPDHYAVFRGTAPGQEGTLVQEDVEDTKLRDTGLVNGTRYYYVVNAVDEFGNLSTNSNEASGVPKDTVAPTVGIHYPTRPGLLYQSLIPNTSLVARTEPGASVTVSNNGVQSATAQALAASTVTTATIVTPTDVTLSPDGRFGVYPTNNQQLRLFDSDSNTDVKIVTLSSFDDSWPAWTPDGTEVVYVDRDQTTGRHYVRAYRIADARIRNVTSPNDGDYSFAALSPDGRKLLVNDQLSFQGRLIDVPSGSISGVPFGNCIDFTTVRWSPDSSRFAFFRGCPDSQIVTIHAATTNVTVVASGRIVEDRPSWSPDSSALVYTATDFGGHAQIMKFSFADSTTTALTSDQSDHREPFWAPDGSAVMYAFNDAEQILNLVDGTTVDLDIPVTDVGAWTFSGYITGWSPDGAWLRIAPAGRVEFKGVPLGTGDNLFTMQGTDASGNVGPSSAAVDVNFATTSLPDLAITDGDLIALPVAPRLGETVRASVTVHNIGTAPTGVPTGLSLFAVDSTGAITALVSGTPVRPLAAGDSQTISASWTATQAGEYQLVAIANPDATLAEVSQTNNLAVRTIEVVSGSGQRLAAITDKTTYVPADTVNGTITTANYDETFGGRLVVAVEDQLGYLVTNVFTGNIVELAYNQSQVTNIAWPTGSTFAGTYQLHARLYDQGNNLVAEAKAPFSISPNSQFSAQVATDKATYLANENVLATANYTYGAGNATVSGAEAWVRIVDASNNVLAQTRQTLGDLLPGATGSLTVNWNTGTSATGGYTALFSLSQQGVTLASAQSPLTVAAGAPNLTGSLVLSDQAPAPGTAEVVTYTIHNAGNAAISQLPVQVSLLDPSAATPIATKSATVDIPVGGDASGTTLFDTTALTLKTYTIQLQALVSGASNAATLATSSFAVVDRAPPVVTLQKPTANGYVRGDATALVFARDQLSSVKSVAVSVDGQPFTSTTISDSANSLYGAALGGLAEGTHTIVSQATDIFNNTGATTATTFIVDNTPPAIQIQGAADGGVYNTNVLPVITVTDANLDKVVQTLNGLPYVSGTPVSNNGKYQLVVTAIDKAGNGAVRSIQFTINTVAPQITVTGVQDGGLYNTDVVPVITVTASGPVTTVITLNGQPFTSGTTVSASNSYVLSVTATDNANNHASVTLHFTIDKVAPVVTITTPANGATLTTRTTDVLGTTEPLATVFLTVGTFQVNAAADAQGAFAFRQVPLAAGANKIVAYAKDRAGNTGPSATTNVTVRSSTAQLNGQIVAHNGVLVYLPGNSETHDCWELGYFGVRDSRSPPAAAHDRYAALYALIQATLAQQGDDYLIVRKESDFVSALRSHRYGTILLGELQPADNDSYYGYGSGSEDDSSLRLSDSTALEMEASVQAGAGIVWIKTHPDEDDDLIPLFGVKPLGVVPNLTQVSLPNSPASTVGTWTTHGFGLKVKLTGGTRVGDLRPGQLPAMVISQYGDGRTALLAFDPSAFSDAQGAMTTLTNALGYATSSSTDTLPGSVVELQWTASQLSAPIDVELKAQVPSGWSFVAAPGGTISSATNAVWDRHVLTDTSVFSALARVPLSKGTYPISAQLFQTQSGGPTLLAQNTFNATLTVSRDDLGAKALNLLRALKVPRSQQGNLQYVISLVQSAIACSQHNANDAAYSINQLVKAVEELQEIEASPDPAAVAVAQLLGAYETLWASYPAGSHW